MKLDFRMYIKLENGEDLKEQLSKLNVQAVDGSKYSFMELAEREDVKVFREVSADVEKGIYNLHDVGKALAYYTSVLGYIWGNVIKNCPDGTVMIADIQDESAMELGDIIFYYLGGGNGQIGQFRLAGAEGNRLHNECDISDFRSLLESEKAKLNEVQLKTLESL